MGITEMVKAILGYNAHLSVTANIHKISLKCKALHHPQKWGIKYILFINIYFLPIWWEEIRVILMV